jgi:hypothetical protein
VMLEDTPDSSLVGSFHVGYFRTPLSSSRTSFMTEVEE